MQAAKAFMSGNGPLPPVNNLADAQAFIGSAARHVQDVNPRKKAAARELARHVLDKFPRVLEGDERTLGIIQDALGDMEPVS